MTTFKTSDGKYTFIVTNGVIDIYRYNQQWIENWTGEGEKAFLALIFDCATLKEKVDQITEKPKNLHSKGLWPSAKQGTSHENS